MSEGSAATGSHAAVVFNPIKVDLDQLRKVVGASAERHGWSETRWYETSEEDPGTGQAKQALEDGATVVLAAGGDGTIRAVAEGLRGSDVPVALLPSGTGNLLARNLKLTIDRLEESVETAFTGVNRKIDLGVVDMERPDGQRDTHAFLVMAGLGLDAAMIANTDTKLKKKVGWLAYVGGIARSLGRSNYIRIRFRLDEESARNLRVNTILIGNCGLLTGNILLLPDAVVDDGQFDIVALRPEGFFGWLQIIWKVIWENGVMRRSRLGRKILQNTKEVRTLRYLRGKQIVVRPDSPQHFQLDGDTMGEVVAVRARVDELALSVRIPRDESGRLPASQEAQEKQDVPA
ncbi:diacylglycerol kinase family protein [Amnibacterium sp. CER49]|uniref:diacylglycerol/lipid kinase family protein n=1 Tax=Amnibacterium sp. CER49 TaxID=3039161 RepID=UPI002449DB1D|nr:diacylglycerol kinase family protein [Amnibacterium sp. CER49]MDH2443528.1 diacylglycerol kinase family protein [Amnibacterium sp. CER49]